jgi:hypothetical protein
MDGWMIQQQQGPTVFYYSLSLSSIREVSAWAILYNTTKARTGTGHTCILMHMQTTSSSTALQATRPRYSTYIKQEAQPPPTFYFAQFYVQVLRTGTTGGSRYGTSSQQAAYFSPLWMMYVLQYIHPCPSCPPPTNTNNPAIRRSIDRAACSVQPASQPAGRKSGKVSAFSDVVTDRWKKKEIDRFLPDSWRHTSYLCLLPFHPRRRRCWPTY